MQAQQLQRRVALTGSRPGLPGPLRAVIRPRWTRARASSSLASDDSNSDVFQREATPEEELWAPIKTQQVCQIKNA